MTQSMREALEEAFKQSGGQMEDKIPLDSVDQDDEPLDTTPQDAAVDTTPQGETTDTRERDEAGKFKQKSEKTEAEKIPNAGKQEDTTAPKDGTTEGVPATLSKEEQAQWDKTPPLVRNAFLRVQNQSQTAVLQAKQELAETKRENAARSAVLEPYAQMWMRNGVPVEQGLAIAMRAVHDMERDPINTIKRLATQYGISLATDGNDSYQDPVMGEVAQLKQQLQQFQQSQVQSQQNYVQQQNMAEVERFQNAKTDSGEPAYPYFDRLLPAMKAMLPAVRQQNPNMSTQDVLKTAYDLSCYADPMVKQEIASTDAARRQQQDYDQRVAASKQARNGMISPAGTTSIAVSSDGGNNRPKSNKEMLYELYGQMGGRV